MPEQDDRESIDILKAPLPLAAGIDQLKELEFRLMGFATGLALRSASGLEPREVLEEISIAAHELMARQARIFIGDVRPALVEEGITLVRWDELSPPEQERLYGYDAEIELRKSA